MIADPILLMLFELVWPNKTVSVFDDSSDICMLYLHEKGQACDHCLRFHK